MKKLYIFLTAVLILLSFYNISFAVDEAVTLSPPEVAGDLLWVRPIGVMKAALGTTAFVVSLPVTLPLGKTKEAKDFLITYIYYYYFQRPIREM
jgi:hypothetical protein